MDDAAVKEFLTHLHIQWNNTLPSTPQTVAKIIATWKIMLKGIPPEYANRAMNQLAVTETFMPRPAQIRKRALELMGKVTPAPEPAAAWIQVQNLGRSVASGTVEPAQIHECILTTIHKLGGISGVAITTNGDRNSFLDVYKSVVDEWLTQRVEPLD